MFGKLSPLLEDIMSLWPLWALIGTGLFGVVAWGLKSWLKLNIVDPIAALNKSLKETYHLLRYHTGPNGTTKAIHKRISDVERALGIEVTTIVDPELGPEDD